MAAALQGKAERGTEVPQPHRSCRAEVQHGLWCHSVSAPRDKRQEEFTGTIPSQGCPSAHCSQSMPWSRSPLQHLPAATARKSSQLLPHCNGSSTGLPQLPGTPAFTRHRSTQLQPNTSPGRTTAPAQLLPGSTENLQRHRMLRAELCPLQRSAPNQELTQLLALQMPQGSKREMPREFSPASAAQMKGSSGSPKAGDRLLTPQHLAGCLPAPAPGSGRELLWVLPRAQPGKHRPAGKKGVSGRPSAQKPPVHIQQELSRLSAGLFFHCEPTLIFSQGSFISFIVFLV